VIIRPGRQRKPWYATALSSIADMLAAGVKRGSYPSLFCCVSCGTCYLSVSRNDIPDAVCLANSVVDINRDKLNCPPASC
jgi:hypothetical protein